ncbi:MULTISPECIES: MFS transporter [Amycolatopsis]|uniref:MFS transporter n=2 Tax=Amycolatopsis TaxID=1813 RepID=A0ABP9QPD0_9PSEU|nr:MFS transporter [Amycolatopsis sacchari]SFK08199.1 MFS transporter, putative metabolite:H+ symporter [Amycolatopsis sacchari]
MSILARLERLPMSRPQYGILFAGGLGHLFEALDIVIIGFMLPHLKAEFGLDNAQIGLIGGAAPVGMIIGAVLAGVVGDRFGRKRVMLYALSLFCAASIALAFANGFAFILAVRVVGGLGAGAEAAIVSPYISEFATGRNRGRFVSGVTLFFSLGNVVAAVLGSLVVPLPGGWRIAAVVCGLPVLVLLWWRRSLPESPRWLLSQGRVADADAVVTRLEERVTAARHGAALPPVPPAAVVAPAAPAVSWSPLRVWRGGLARVSVATWLGSFVFLFAFFGFFTWMPSLFLEIGVDPGIAATYSFFLFVAQPIGYLVAIAVSDRFERRTLLVTFFGFAALASIALGIVPRDSVALLLIGMVLSVCITCISGIVFPYCSEVYPTAIRATGAGLASTAGNAGGLAAPVVIGLTFGSIGFGGVFAVMAALLALGGLVIRLFGPRVTGKTLEQVFAAETAPIPAGEVHARQ